MSVLCARYLFRGDLLLLNLAIMSCAVSSPLFTFSTANLGSEFVTRVDFELLFTLPLVDAGLQMRQ